MKRKLEDIDFNCIVCTDLLLEPTTLECGHTFCLRCTTKIKNATCPMCRAPFRSPKKNNLLEDIMKTVYKDQYDERLFIAENLKKYYGSSRFDSLCDYIVNCISDGKKTSGFAELVKYRDPNIENGNDNGNGNENALNFPLTLDDIVISIMNHTHTNEFKYLTPEIKVAVCELLVDKTIIKVKNYYGIRSESWIYDCVTKLDEFLSNDDVLFLTSHVKTLSGMLGDIITRRTKDGSRADNINLIESETEIINLIKSNQIVL